MEQIEDEKRICHECVEEQFLSKEIKSTGEFEVCSYCEREGSCWSIGKLADRIELAFSQHYTRTSPEPDDWQLSLLRDRESDYEWERDGLPVHDAIEDAAGIPEQAIDDILEILGERNSDWESAQMGVESEFDSDSYYEQKASDAAAWQYEWRHFENTLRTEARYFGRVAATHLAAVFGGIDKLRTRDGRPLVVDAGPGTLIEVLCRARVFQSEEPLKEALCRPDLHLGSPPARVAAAGRMNARGISVFYGATSQGVALAEVRPPVGSDVALAEFKIIRPLRLLDLSALEKAFDGGSVFDPTLLQRLERVAFLQSLGSKMTRPVMPDDQEFDYLATQAVADFLATENEPAMDGIIFKSTQSEEGDNIVLFHKASRVKSMDLPAGVKMSAGTKSCDSDGWYPDYNVWEEVPVPEEEKAAATQKLGFLSQSAMFDHARGDEDLHMDTLEVIPDTVKVHYIKKVKVESDSHKVERHRRQMGKSERF